MEAWVATRNTEIVEPATQIAHEGVPGADDLSAWEGLEAAVMPTFGIRSFSGSLACNQATLRYS